MNANGQNHYQDWDLFVLGVLEGQEKQDMSAHLSSGCDDCLRLYLAAKALLPGLATLSPDEPLPPGAEMRLRKRLEDAGQLSGARSRVGGRRIWQAAPWVLAAACLLAAFGVEISLRTTKRDLVEQERQNSAYRLHLQETAMAPGQVTELQNTIAGLRRDLQAAQAQLAEARAHTRALDASLKDAEARRSEAEQALSAAHLQLSQAQAGAARLLEVSARDNQILALLESTPLSQLDLKPTGAVQASARVYWQNDRGLLLVARDLPALPEHGSFQLWFYRQGKPEFVNVGVVQMEKSGTGLLFVPPGPALLAMTGALLTEESQPTSAAAPGREILKVKP
jgi:hypothetical protein